MCSRGCQRELVVHHGKSQKEIVTGNKLIIFFPMPSGRVLLLGNSGSLLRYSQLWAMKWNRYNKFTTKKALCGLGTINATFAAGKTQQIQFNWILMAQEVTHGLVIQFIYQHVVDRESVWAGVVLIDRPVDWSISWCVVGGAADYTEIPCV